MLFLQLTAQFCDRDGITGGHNMGHIPNKRAAERRQKGLPPPRQKYEPKGPAVSIGGWMGGLSPKWAWAHCTGQLCNHSSAVAFAQFAIRWGMDASTDMIRQRLVCSQCGHRGAQLTIPSMAGAGGLGGYPQACAGAKCWL